MLFAIIILSLIVIGLGYLTWNYYSKHNLLEQKTLQLSEQFRTYKQQSYSVISYLESKTIHRAIVKSLQAMDKVTSFYIDEDEGNRELTACLEVQGFIAKYQHSADNRTFDIFVDNCIIVEGKLDPTQSDIDRLTGQVEDYLKYGHQVFIVVYGYLFSNLKERIEQQIITRHEGSVFLICLDNPRRIRRNNEQ
jgi:hypothetical protein